MTNSGVAIMGSASAEGENRAMTAIQDALSSPLLNNNDIHGASNILLNLTSGSNEIRMDEVGQITDYVQEASGQKANIIWGIGNDQSLGDKINITIIATGFNVSSIPEIAIEEKQKKDVVSLSDTMVVNKSKAEPVEMEEIETEAEEKPQSIEFDLTEQRTIEFEGTGDQLEKYELDAEKAEKKEENETGTVEVKKISEEKIKKRNKKHEELKRISYKGRKSVDINELEKEPAYLRKKINLDDSQISSTDEDDTSKYTLSEDEEKNIKLSEDNKYLHDNVD